MEKNTGVVAYNKSEMLIMWCQANMFKEKRLGNTGATNQKIIDGLIRDSVVR